MALGKGRALIVAAGLAALAVPAALAQQPPRAEAADPGLAQAARVQAFDIPAQPLGSALIRFSEATGIQLFFDATIARGLQSPGVNGTMSRQDALGQLLAGTGLLYRFTNATTVTLEKPGATGATGATTTPPGVVPLDPVRVQASPPPVQAEIGNLPPVYAGGQVARGGKVGFLGNRDYMDTPFSETIYTEKFIQNQQARTLTDVVASDPTVRSGWPDGNAFDDRMMIRGIQVNNTNFGFGGLYGIVPGEADLTGIERVEVFRGPTAFLNGALPSAVGGTINLVPKRATSDPITRVVGLYQSDTQFGGSIDVGRRFGPDDAVGVRVNGTYTSGNTTVDRQAAERLALTGGFDFRSDNTRIDADIGYLRRDIDQFQGGMFLAAGVQLPPAPNARNSSYQPWERLQTNDTYGALRFEHDITPGLTGFIKVGAKRTNLQSVFFNQNIINYNGNTTTTTAGQFLSQSEVLSAEAGARAVFTTGPVKHEAAVVGDYLKTTNWSFNNPLAIGQTANIYAPRLFPTPSFFGLRQNAPLTSDSLLASIGIVDALSFAEDRIQLIGGARLQRLQTANYSIVTGMPTSGNDQTVVSPSVSLVVKPIKELAIYGNYIQALQQGPLAGAGLSNAGEQFAPFVSKQFEIGAKLDLGNFGATLSAFQITQPSSFVNFATNTLVTDGLQRNRGLEFLMFGEPLEGFKLLGGFTLLQATLLNTQGGLANGNTAVGTSPFQLALTADWDTPFAPGFGVMGRIIHVGEVYLNQANTQAAPPYTRIDAGVRYAIERSSKVPPVIVRANVINLFDANYWIATNAFFVQNQPRTFYVSLTVDF